MDLFRFRDSMEFANNNHKPRAAAKAARKGVAWEDAYTHGGVSIVLHRDYIEAKNRDEALKKLRQRAVVVEVKCCVRAITW